MSQDKNSSVIVSFLKEGEESTPIQETAHLGEYLNQVAYRAGITIQQTCGGVPSCTDCKVVVKEGIEGGFEPAAGPELRLMGNVYFITHERLSCQAKIAGPSTVFVPTPRRPVEKNAARMALIQRQRRERQTEENKSTGEDRHGKKESPQKSSKESSQKAREEKGRSKKKPSEES